MYLEFNIKQAKPNGDVLVMRVWRTIPSQDYPEGIRYSFAYIRNGARLVAYDNFHGKGHHRHVKGREEKYAFVDEWKLFEDFGMDLVKIEKGIIK